MRFPEDFFTAFAVLVVVAALMWWRHRYPTRHDITVHLDQKQDEPPPDAQKPPE